MYIKRITLKNIRGCSRFEWNVESGSEPGWHVILGDNGAGKTTVLQAIALSLVGEKNARALRQDWATWLKKGTDRGSIEVETCYPYLDESPRLKTYALAFERDRDSDVIEMKNVAYPPGKESKAYFKLKPFSSSFGAFRRLDEGQAGKHVLPPKDPLYPHLSLFDASMALSDTLEWLKEIRFSKLEGLPEGDIYDQLRVFINEGGLLPGKIKLDKVSPEGVFFHDGHQQLDVLRLSDGYRSVLGMIFELIRQLAERYGYQPERLFAENLLTIDRPGVVLIDEVDAHLHPSWQQTIGQWLTKYFPRMQFIVSTHSPLVCQAAEKGSIWRIPHSSRGKEPYRVVGQELDRLIYGDILDAMSTDFFGEEVSFSDKSQHLRNRLAELNQKALLKSLSSEEEDERRSLKRIFASNPSIQDSVA